MYLDGQQLAVGIQPEPSYQVPAGPASGIGASVVLACDSRSEHTIAVRWRLPTGETTVRTFVVTKELA